MQFGNNRKKSPQKLISLIAIGLGGIIFLSMFCSTQFLLFLAAVTLILLGAAMLICAK